MKTKWTRIVLCLVLLLAMVVVAACEGVIPPEYQAMIDEYDTLKADVTKLGTDLAAANAKVTDLTAQLADAKAGAGDLAAANSKIASLTAELAAANASVTSLSSDLATANSQISSLQSQLAAAESNSAELATLRAQVAALEGNAYFLESQVASLNSQLNNALDDLEYATLESSVYEFALMYGAGFPDPFTIVDHRDGSTIDVQFSGSGTGVSISDLDWLEAALPDINAAYGYAIGNPYFDFAEEITYLEALVHDLDEFKFAIGFADDLALQLMADIPAVDEDGDYVGNVTVKAATADRVFYLDLNGYDFGPRLTLSNVITPAPYTYLYSLTAGIIDSTDSGATIGSINSDYGISVQGGSTDDESVEVTLQDINVVGRDGGLGTNASITVANQFDTEIFAENVTFTGLSGDNSAGAYLPANNMYGFGACTFIGETGVYVKGGLAMFDDCTLIGEGDYAAPRHNGGGFYSTGDALAVDDCVGYNNPIEIGISGGEFISANGDGIHLFSTAADPAARENDITLQFVEPPYAELPTFDVDRYDASFEAYSEEELLAASGTGNYTAIIYDQPLAFGAGDDVGLYNVILSQPVTITDGAVVEFHGNSRIDIAGEDAYSFTKVRPDVAANGASIETVDGRKRVAAVYVDNGQLWAWDNLVITVDGEQDPTEGAIAYGIYASEHTFNHLYLEDVTVDAPDFDFAAWSSMTIDATDAPRFEIVGGEYTADSVAIGANNVMVIGTAPTLTADKELLIIFDNAADANKIATYPEYITFLQEILADEGWSIDVWADYGTGYIKIYPIA
jgi:Tfp pilus assembly protein PilO